MAARKSKSKKLEENEAVVTKEVAPKKVEAAPKKVEVEPKKVVKKETGPKFKVGSVVFVSKNASADLNGFKLFPQYKKYPYTVEAYDSATGVYSLRKLNLLLKLKEADIVAPSEKHDSPLIRKQY